MNKQRTKQASAESLHQTIDNLNSDAWQLRSREPEKAARLAREAIGLARQSGYAHGMAQSLLNAAAADLLLSDYNTARSQVLEALEILRRTGDRPGEAQALNVLGSACRRLGEYEESFLHYTESLRISSEFGLKNTKMGALNGLGSYYRLIGDYDRAIESHRAGYEIAAASGNHEEEAQSLLAIGNTLERLGSYHEALDYYTRCNDIATRIDHPRLQAYATGNISIIHQRFGNNALALSYELQSMKCKEEMNDTWGIGVSLNNIGIIYKELGEYAAALEAHFRSLEITEQIKDRQGEAVALNNIGMVYEIVGNRTHVIEYYFRSLRIAREIGDHQGESYALNHIGRFYERHGDHAWALLYYFKSLRMLEASGDRNGSREVLNNIGAVYRELEEYDKAEEYYHRSLQLAVTTVNRPGEIMTLLNLGLLCNSRGEYTTAMQHLEEGLRIATESGNSEQIRDALAALADSCRAAGDSLRSGEYRKLFQQQTQRIFNSESNRRIGELAFNFVRNDVQREGEYFGLGEEDLAEIGEIIRKGSQGKRSLSADDVIDTLSDYPEAGTVTHHTDDMPAAQLNSVPEASDSIISVTTFGRFSVALNSRTLQPGDWKRKRARDLFKLLLVHHRHWLTIDEIIERLWKSAGDRNAEMLVMNAVSHIRSALQPERTPHSTRSLLSGSERSYMLDLGDRASIDFLRFKELVVAARRSTRASERQLLYEQAVRIYQGDFLKEDAFEEWTTPERDLLKDAFLEALEFIAGEQLRTGKIPEAIECARRILTHDNTSERAYEILLTALRDRGRSGEARKVLEQCAKVFQEELGTPVPERLKQIMD